MIDTIEIIKDHSATILSNGWSAPRWSARLNGIPMSVSEAMEKVRANPDNDGNLRFPPEMQQILASSSSDFAAAYTCEYCKSVSSAERCPSCGAPRHKKAFRKRNTESFPECIHAGLWGV